MLVNKLSAHPQNGSSFAHLSPQAFEALRTLEQIKNQKNHTAPQNSKIVRRITSQYCQPTLIQCQQNRSSSVLQASPIPVRNENITNSSLQNSFMKGQLQSHRTNKLETEGSRKPSSQTERQFSYQQTLAKSDEPTPFFRDTLSSDRNNCNQSSLNNFLAKHQISQQFKYMNDELQAFKQQVQNDVLIETVITKFESPKDSLKHQDSQKLLSSSALTIEEFQQKENASPSTQSNLMKKKKTILNQILQLDNQIKMMEDEKTKMTLDPLKQSNLGSKVNQSCSQRSLNHSITENLYKRAQHKQQQLKKNYQESQQQKSMIEMKECTFVPKINKQHISGSFMERLDEWVKRKNNKLSFQQNVTQELAMKECTFSPLSKVVSRNNISLAGVYQRNQEWQGKVNMKKQKLKVQKSMLQSSGKQSSLTPQKINRRSQSTQYQIDLAKILKSSNTQNTTKRIQQSPKYMDLENVDNKYEQLCQLAKRIKSKAKQ